MIEPRKNLGWQHFNGIEPIESRNSEKHFRSVLGHLSFSSLGTLGTLGMPMESMEMSWRYNELDGLPMKNGDFPRKNGDLPMKKGDFP